MHGNIPVVRNPIVRGVFVMKLLVQGIARAKRSGLVIIAGILSFLLISCGNSGGRPATQAVPPPGNVALECVKQGVKVSWDPVPGAMHYTVFWGLAPKDYRRLADCQSLSLIITGLQPGKLYAFAVSSWGDTGESDFSGEELIVFDDGRGRPKEYLTRARQLMAEGSLRQAHAHVAAAIGLDPRLGDAYLLRAALYEQLNKPEQASQDYAMADKLVNGKRVTLRRSTN